MLNSTLKKKLSQNEYQRYARQIIIKEINIKGQQRLKQAKVLCVGLGGLNSPALLYLSASGIGNLGIIDQDYIEISNLQRQVLYNTHDIDKQKVKVAFDTLKNLNPEIIINSHNSNLTIYNIKDIILNYDIIIDGTDNFHVRYIISEYCYRLHKIHIYGAIEKFNGQVSVFNYQSGPHYYSLYKQKSHTKYKNCNSTGLINTLAGIIGTLQATEAIKIVLGVGNIISEQLLICNILQGSFYRTNIKKEKIINTPRTRFIKKNKSQYISLTHFSQNQILLIDVRTPIEFQINHEDQSINIPLNKFKQEKTLQFLLKKRTINILLCCDNENRSYIASQILYKYHIKSYILEGGLNAIRKERDSNPR